jgi:hypothetical protein
MYDINNTLVIYLDDIYIKDVIGKLRANIKIKEMGPVLIFLRNKIIIKKIKICLKINYII